MLNAARYVRQVPESCHIKRQNIAAQRIRVQGSTSVRINTKWLMSAMPPEATKFCGAAN